MWQWVFSLFNRGWVVYALMFVLLFFFFDRNQVADDVLNTSRPSADYLHFFSYRTKPFDVNEFKRAKAYYQTLISGKFSTAAMHANLGFCDHYLKNISGAIRNYDKAIQMDQKMYAFYFDRGLIAQSQGDHLKAVDMFRKSIFLLPKNKEELLDQLHISAKYRSQMMFEYYYQNRVPWDQQMAYVHLLESLTFLKSYEELLGYAAAAIKIFPDDPEIFYYASLGAYKNGYVKESLGFIIRALTIAPNYAKACELKAMLSNEIGDVSTAKTDMGNAKFFQGKNGWQRMVDIEELHHWDENTLLFQIYR